MPTRFALQSLENDRAHAEAQLSAAPTGGWGTVRVMWENRLREIEAEIAALNTTSNNSASVALPGITPSEDEMSDLDPDLVRIGQSSDSMERRALALIGPIHNGYYRPGNPPTYGLPGVCERSTLPLPHGCWDHGNRSPYSTYGDDRWCNACIAYAALNGKLPRPEQQIEMTLAQPTGRKLVSRNDLRKASK